MINILIPIERSITPKTLSIITIPDCPNFILIHSDDLITIKTIKQFIKIEKINSGYSICVLRDIIVDNVPGPEIKGKATVKKEDDGSDV